MATKQTISQLKDGAKFRLSKRSGVYYKVIKKWRYPKPYAGSTMATITSLSSERSYIKTVKQIVYVD